MQNAKYISLKLTFTLTTPFVFYGERKMGRHKKLVPNVFFVFFRGS